MPTSTIQISGSAAGISLNSSITKTAPGLISQDPSIPAAKAGTLSTWTDNDTGVLTLGASHGITDADVVDVYWSGGKRRGMTVGTVAGTSVPIDGGSGDNLPVQDTVITVMKQQVIDVDFDADLLRLIVFSGPARASIGFIESSSEVFDVEVPAGGFWFWHDGMTGFDNPLEGHVIDQVVMTHADATQAQVLKLGALYNSGP